MTRVVVTGVGLVCGLGETVATAWPRLMNGDIAIAPISRFDASAYSVRLAAEVPGPFDVPTGVPGVPAAACRRGTRFFLRAAREAWAHADVTPADPARAGVAAGASANYLHMAWVRESWRRRTSAGRLDVGGAQRDRVMDPCLVRRRETDWMAAVSAASLGLEGPQVVTDTACAAGSHAIVRAWQEIRHGRADVMLAGAGCALVVPLTLLAFSRLGALSANPDPATASRPFDRDRDGFVIGEGAAALVLESFDHARRRGAAILAELAGAGLTSTAASLTDPSADGEPEARAIGHALSSANRPADRVQYVAAHGTSTPRNDVTETLAIRRAFGACAGRLMVSSCKGQLGHTLAAAGALNAVMAVQAVSRGEIAPTATLRTADAACDLDYVPGRGRQARVSAALATAFAFGGHNAALLFTRV